jgi:uncharacterized protein (DUF1499 family)
MEDSMANLSPLLLLLVLLASCGSRITTPGVIDGKLAACPATPNCVSSQSTDKEHAIAPLRFEGSVEEARQRLLDVIKAQKRAKIVSNQGNRIHAEFTSAIFRFVDDVDFIIDDAAKTIHVRSASRVGRSDLGVNRRRVEALRSQFEQSGKSGR